MQNYASAYFIRGELLHMEGKANGLSIAGFVISLVSCFLVALYGIAGLVGLILSAVGRSQAVREGGKTGLATAGIVLGIISVACGLYTAIVMSL